MNESSSFMQTENPPVIYSGDYKTPGNLEKSEVLTKGAIGKAETRKRQQQGVLVRASD